MQPLVPHHRHPSQAEIRMIRHLIVVQRIIRLVAANVVFDMHYRDGEWRIVEEEKSNG